MPKANKVLIIFDMNDEQKERLEAINQDAEYTYSTPDALTPDIINEYDIVLGSVGPKIIADSKRLKWLQLGSAGSDSYQGLSCFSEGAILTNGSGAYGLTISEHTIAMILMLKRKIHLHIRAQLENKWEKSPDAITSLYGSRVLVIGLGDLGTEFSKKAKAMGAYIIGISRTKKPKPEFVDEIYTADNIDNQLPLADVITLSLPNTDATKRIINRERIGMLQKNAIIVNVGRGSAIDTEALTEALASGSIEGAALDVTDPEPLPEDHKLWKLPNVIITPHVAGTHNLPETRRILIEIAIGNYDAYTNNKPMRNVVDFKRQY